MEIIDNKLLDGVSEQARCSSCLRKNYKFHQSPDDKCHRFLNAMKPGTVVPIHRHSTKDESFVSCWWWGRSMDGESVKVKRCIVNLISGFIWKE